MCCGGGGLLAGVAAAVKLSGSKARVVGVEPEGAQSMMTSVARGEASCLLLLPHYYCYTTIATLLR